MDQEITITLKATVPEGTDLPKRLNYVLADALSEYNARRLRRSWGAPTMEEAQAYVEERYKTKEGSSWPTDAWRAEKAVMVLAATTWASALRDAALQMGPVEIRNVHRCTCCGATFVNRPEFVTGDKVLDGLCGSIDCDYAP